MLQRIALYTTLGLVLSVLEIAWDTWAFWSIVALYWASEALTRREGYEAGMVFIATLPEEHLERIRQEIARIDSKED
jgi:hypothetical protein